MRFQLEPIELEVDLDPSAESCKAGQEPVVARDPDAIRVEDDPRDLALGRRIDDLEDLRVDGRLAAAEHQDVHPPALAHDRRVERPHEMGQPGEARDARSRGGEAGRAVQVAVLGDVEQEHARVLGLQVTEALGIAHRDRRVVAWPVRDDLPGRRSPLLERVPERVGLLVERCDLAMPAPAVAPQVDAPVHRDEVALEDVRLVVELAIGVLREAVPAHGQDHPERCVRTKREHPTLPRKLRRGRGRGLRSRGRSGGGAPARRRPAAPRRSSGRDPARTAIRRVRCRSRR